MRLLARRNRVLWLNSVATRTPKLSSGSDRRKLAHRLASLSKGPTAVEDGLWVYTPLVLPLPHSRAATLLNRQLLRYSVGRIRRDLGMRTFQLWAFIPTAANYLGVLGESLVVYYCVDEWSQMPRVDSARMSTLDRRLCERADLVVTTSRALYEGKRAWNPETHLVTHGVDHRHFATALADATPVAAELDVVPPPILGFFGLVEEWVDLDLLAYLAERRPAWTIALIGKVGRDVSRLGRYPNVRLLGRRPYEELPRYCKAFSVGLIPFVVNELTRNVNPIKLREYLSAGLPVVSTALPEAAAYGEHCAVANSYEEFERAVEAALRDDGPERRRARSRAMQVETWERKVGLAEQQVARVAAERRPPAVRPERLQG
jgi:glycosyltransferase involved in cell wall biosynthesis